MGDFLVSDLEFGLAFVLSVLMLVLVLITLLAWRR